MHMILYIGLLYIVHHLVPLGLWSLDPVASATPIIALKEADNCAGCHTPGRAQLPFFERRCTLDCQGCHIDPSGGGARSQWGHYYSQDQLAIVNFLKPIDPLADTSRYDLHYDGRYVRRNVNNQSRAFPMSSDITLRLRPFVEYLHLVYNPTLLGRTGDSHLRLTPEDERRLRQKYFLMVDALPLATYVKVGRGQPMYGLRRPNHTLWIRERIGMDQFAITDAVDFGGTINVPFWRVSIMSGDPYAADEDKQKGTSWHYGLRGVTLGWHLNGSLWDTTSEKTRISMRSFGAGLKPWWFVLYAERNWREVSDKTSEASVQETLNWESPHLRTHPSSVISEYTASFVGLRGMMLHYVYEHMDINETSERRNWVLEAHPIPWLQLEAWWRNETGANNLADTLFLSHVYFDW